MINAGQDILNSGKKRIDTIQTALPAIENAYINAMRTAQAYFPTAKKMSRKLQTLYVMTCLD